MILYTDIDPFCCAVLASRVADGALPDGDVVMADIRDLNAGNLAGYRHVHTFCGIGGIPLGLAWAGWPESVSIFTGGFPCQDISTAGKGAGLSGDKSGLFWELRRILMELNEHGDGPELVILENVGALSRRGLDVVAAAMGEAGYVVPESYRVGAWALGAPHKRERWWIVGWRVGRAIANGVRGGPRDAKAGRQERTGVVTSGSGESRGKVGDTKGARSRRISTRSGRSDEATVNADGSGARESLQPDTGGAQCEAGRREPRDQGGPWCRGYQPGPGDWREYKDEWFWCGPPVLVHAGGAGLEQRDTPAVPGNARHAAGRPDPTLERGWPAPVLPGYVQHDWELPRLYQRGVGDAVHGLPRRVAGARNRAGIMALGNAVVPQVVAAIGKGVRAAIGGRE